MLLLMVTSKNPVSSTIGGFKLHCVVFRKCRVFVRSTNTGKLSRYSKLYKEQVGALEENTDPLITENKIFQVK